MLFRINSFLQLYSLIVDVQRSNDTSSADRNKFECKVSTGNESDPSEKCSHWFYKCSDFVGERTLCRGNQYFNSETNRCDQYANVATCSPVFDCAKVGDGNFADLRGTVVNGQRIPFCSNQWFSCTKGVLVVKYCDQAYYYDKSNDRCDYFDHVYDCRIHAPLPLTHGTQPSTIHDTGTTKRHKKTKAPKYFFDCTDLINGELYPHPEQQCSNIFFQCDNGIGWQKKCGAVSTYFDVTVQECDYKENVPACTGLTRPSTIATMKSSTSSHLSTTSDQSATSNQSSGSSDFSNSSSQSLTAVTLIDIINSTAAIAAATNDSSIIADSR